MDRVTTLCVIPARRGSKRIPNKNMALLDGRPMLEYTIEAALESGCFQTVYVSTEDPQIAAAARRAGAQPHARPEALAGDLVSATDVCIELADHLEARGARFDAIVCLQPSSPLRRSDDIVRAVQRFESSKADYLVSVAPIDPHYFHWAVHEADGGWWRMWFGNEFLKERPLLPPVYRPNGAIKIGRTDALRRTRNFFGQKLAISEMDESRSVHVAVPSDLVVAESLLRARSVEERG